MKDGILSVEETDGGESTGPGDIVTLDSFGNFELMFEFRLHDYKQRPDWLNARYWAHPERFDMTDHHND